MSPKPRVFDESDYAAPVDPGVEDDLYAYLATDNAGTTGVVYYETAGGARVALLAASQVKADLLRPIAQHLATVMDREVSLHRFQRWGQIDVIRPEQPAGPS